MRSSIDSFIENICNNECQKYFKSSKKYAYEQIKISIPPPLSQRDCDCELQIKIARIASPIIKRINEVDRNRFWVLYYRLSDELINLKCNQSNLSHIDKMLCVEYMLDRVINQIKAFDIYYESAPFQKTMDNMIEICERYRSMDKLLLDIDYKELKNSGGVVGNYTNKILCKYNKDSIDVESIEAIIENVLFCTESDKTNFFNKKEKKSCIEKEVLNYFNNNKKRVETIIYPILTEICHQEKFFNYIYNNFINSRFIDFTRTISIKKNALSSIIKKQPQIESLTLGEILEQYINIIPPETQLILQLKIGESISNRDFIKLVYMLNYREIGILEHFEDEEILEIKFYARNNIDISPEVDKKISEIREKLKANSYINREDDTKRVILLKLIFSEEMNAKEIGVLLGYTDKQIYKKIERIKNKIKYKKGLTSCKEM